MVRWPRALLPFGLGLALLGLAPAAAAADPKDEAQLEVGTPEAVAAARTHFTKGRELYQAGAYREAIVELDAARALDPKAKDLVFNLGVVHEKLGEIDEALRYAKLYAEMDLEPAERTRAESYIKRLEGAKLEVLARRKAAAPPPPIAIVPVRGRIDAATIAAGAVAAGAAIAGIAFGVKALTDKPGSSVSATTPAAALQSQLDTAHSEGVIADVCFGGAAAAAAVAVGLYFGRYRDPQPAKQAFTLTPVLAPGSGSLVLGGVF